MSTRFRNVPFPPSAHGLKYSLSDGRPRVPCSLDAGRRPKSGRSWHAIPGFRFASSRLPCPRRPDAAPKVESTSPGCKPEGRVHVAWMQAEGRNPGDRGTLSPDFASLHPGYHVHVARTPPEGRVHVARTPPEGRVHVARTSPEGRVHVARVPPEGRVHVAWMQAEGRNPGDRGTSSPDFASLHPGYHVHVARTPPEGRVHVARTPPRRSRRSVPDPGESHRIQTSIAPPRGFAVPELFPSDRYADSGRPGFPAGCPTLVIHRFQRGAGG